MISRDHFVCPVLENLEMKDIGWKKKCWGFRKTGEPGLTWLTGSYAPGRDPARLENYTGSNQKQITQLVGRAATLEENIDYTLNIGGRTLKTDKLANKLIYNSLRNKVSKKPTAEKKLKQFIGDNDLTLVYSMPFNITKSTKLQYFQFKISHGYFPTNRYLNKVNKPDTNFCQYCNIDDDIEYYFISCQRTKSLWQKFSCFTELVFGKQNLTIVQILFGILRSDKKSLALNWLVLIMKYYIYKCKWRLSFKAFKENAKYELKLEKEGEKLDKNRLPFKWKWQIIDSCLVTHWWFLSLWFLLFSFYFFAVIIIITIMSSHLYLFSNNNIKNSAETIAL